jgi:hypothetical protein
MIKAAKGGGIWPFMIPAVKAFPGLTLVSLLETSIPGAFEAGTNIAVECLELVLISWKHLDAVTP